MYYANLLKLSEMGLSNLEVGAPYSLVCLTPKDLEPMSCNYLPNTETKYTLTSVMPPPLLYPQTLGNRCAQFKYPSLLSHFPLTCCEF